MENKQAARCQTFPLFTSVTTATRGLHDRRRQWTLVTLESPAHLLVVIYFMNIHNITHTYPIMLALLWPLQQSLVCPTLQSSESSGSRLFLALLLWNASRLCLPFCSVLQQHDVALAKSFRSGFTPLQCKYLKRDICANYYWFLLLNMMDGSLHHHSSWWPLKLEGLHLCRILLNWEAVHQCSSCKSKESKLSAIVLPSHHCDAWAHFKQLQFRPVT